MHLTSVMPETFGLLLGILLWLLTLPALPAAERTRHRSSRTRRTRADGCRCGCDGTCSAVAAASRISNSDLLSKWKEHLERTCASKTVVTYLPQAERYLTDLERRASRRKNRRSKPSWMLMTPDDVESYLNRRVVPGARAAKGSHLAPNSRRTLVTALRSLSKWAHKKRLAPQDYLAALELPAAGRSKVRYIPWRLQQLILSEARATDDRLYLMVTLMLRGGFRCIEVAQARIDDVELELAEMGVRGKGHRGEISRWIPLVGELSEALDAWLDGKPRSGALAGGRRLWQPGKPLTEGAVSKMVNAFLHSLTDPKTGEELAFSAHDLRHSFGRMLKKGGRDRDAVRKALGHVNEATTDLYTSGVDEHVKVAFDATAAWIAAGGGDALSEGALRRIGATARHAGLGERAGDSSHLLGPGDHRVAARSVQQPNR